MGSVRTRGCSEKIILIVIASLVLSGALNDCLAQGELDRLELKYSIDQEKLQLPLEQLHRAYTQRLERLQKEFGAAGNLDGVLAARTAAEAEEPRADQISEIPELAKLQNLFLEEKEKRLRQKAESLHELRTAYLNELGTLHGHLTRGGDAAAAKPVEERMGNLAEEIQQATPPQKGGEIQFVDDLEMTGRFYNFVNASASFYVNGKRVHRAKKGKSVSQPCSVRVGDCVVFSLHNGDGGRKRFQTAFMSEDKAHVISFAAKDLKVIPDGDRRRSVTGLEFGRMSVFANTRDHPGEDAGIPFEHSSEWVWDHGNNAILAVIIKPDMIHATSQPPAR